MPMCVFFLVLFIIVQPVVVKGVSKVRGTFGISRKLSSAYYKRMRLTDKMSIKAPVEKSFDFYSESRMEPVGTIQFRNDTELRQYLLEAVRDPMSRASALRILLNMNNTRFSPAECKTLLAGVIFTKSESLTELYISRMRELNYLTSELLYVGIRTSCRRRLGKLAYKFLLAVHAQNDTLVTDIDSINFVLNSMVHQPYIEEAMNIFSLMYNGGFGKYIAPDITTYSRIVNCACKARNASALVHCFSCVVKESSLADDAILVIDALKFCALTGMFEAAKDILYLYRDNNITVKPQAYSLLFVSYKAYRKEYTHEGTRSNMTMLSRDPLQEIIVDIETNMSVDCIPIDLCDQILQYHCLEYHVDDAYRFFISLNSRVDDLSASTLTAYSALLKRSNDNNKISAFMYYLRSRNIDTSVFMSRINEKRKTLFKEIKDAAMTMKRKLYSNESAKVRIEYVYYIIAQAAHEKKYDSGVSFFLDYCSATKRNIPDIIVFSGCVEQILTRMPFKSAYQAIPTILQLFQSLNESTYLQHLSDRIRRKDHSDGFTVVTPEPSSRLTVSAPLLSQELSFQAFMNIQYLILLDVLMQNAQYSLLPRVAESIRIEDGISEVIFEDFLSTNLLSSLNLETNIIDWETARPLMQFIPPSPSPNYSELWRNRAEAIIGVISALSRFHFTLSESVSSLLIQQICNRNIARPFSPSLAAYVGSTELRSPNDIPVDYIDVDNVLERIGLNRTSCSVSIQKDILAAYLSYFSVDLMSHQRAFDYYEALSNASSSSTNPNVFVDMKISIDSAVRDTMKPFEPHYSSPVNSFITTDESKSSLQSRLFKSTASSFHDTNSSVKLYNKVLETLLRAHRSQDAKSLLQLMLAKNISTKPAEVYVLMGHEIKAGNPIGAIEVFTAFFHMPNSAPPDSRSISLLAVALSKTKSLSLGSSLAVEILPFIISQKLQLSVPVCEAYFSFCMHSKDAENACTYILLIPPLERKLGAITSLLKLCALTNRIDILNMVIVDQPQPFEIICHSIANYALKGLWIKVFHTENVLRRISLQRGIVLPPWALTFLLYAAATGGRWDHATRLAGGETPLSELEYNLVLYACLKHIHLLPKAAFLAEGVVPKKLDLIVSFLKDMGNLQYRIHPILIVLGDTIQKSGKNIGQILTVFNEFVLCSDPSSEIQTENTFSYQDSETTSPQKNNSRSSERLKALSNGYTTDELQKLRLLDTYLVSALCFGRSK